MRQSGFLADLRDPDTIDAALPEQMPGRFDQRRAIFGGLFLGDFQLILSARKELTTKIAVTIIAPFNNCECNY